MASDSDRAEIEKRIKALGKKLKQIESLKEKSSDQLDSAARDKISSEPALQEELKALQEELSGGSGGTRSAFKPAPRAAEPSGQPEDPLATERTAALEAPPADLGLLLDDETEKRFKALQKKLRDISKLREKDKLDKLQQEKLLSEPGLISELQEIRKQADEKLKARRQARQAASANVEKEESKPAVKVKRPAWECPNCEASGGVEDLMSGDGSHCPKCGYEPIAHFAPEQNEEEGDEETEEKSGTKAKSFESKDLKTARQRAQPASKKKEEDLKVSPANAKWAEVKEVLESGDCGVDKGRQKKAIAVDQPKSGAPYDAFDSLLLKCSFLTRVELKLPKGVLASESFMLYFPGPLSENLMELILKENHLEEFPPNLQELKRIRSIDLSHNLIKQLPEPDVWQSVAGTLELLDLSFNQLDSVTSLSPLSKLSQLKLDANKLTSLDGVTWKDLKQLSMMSAVGNEIKELSNEIGEHAASLEHLELSENKLTTLPPNLCELKKVKLIGIAGNPIKDQKVIKAAEKGTKDLKTYLSKSHKKK
eukprot:TRINITY_DN60651_c0_g1_i1.p1 TRINITY_DN60651_c0_g1~~TRINITY_DN60651_c0_g1_i1.p1  ORF type:complete len:538 (+),score=150.07 TRINITY_DN60651_c0_g1_i1:58-1671(+)